MVFAHFTTIAKRLKTADDWRNDEAMAGGDAFFEEGIHWLHLAGSLGPRITSIARATGRRRRATGPDTRAKSMMVAFRYDNGAVGSLYYSREIPSLLQGLRLSKLFGRERRHHVRVERRCSCSSRGSGLPRLRVPGLPRHPRLPGDVSRLRRRRSASGRAPEMSLERAIDDQRLMDQIYATRRARPRSDRTLRHHHHRQRRRRRHDGARAVATAARAS